MASVRDQAFISYSKDDQKWLNQLLKVLAQLIRAKPNAIWWDGRIRAGQVWREEIQKALTSARVAVLLVSPGFLASEFILEVELPQILDDAERGGVKVLWSLVRNCPWEVTPISRYQAVHYQETHAMKAWNALNEAELDDLLKSFAREIENNLRSELAPPGAVERPQTVRAAEATPGVAADRTAVASTPPKLQTVAQVPPASAAAESGHRAAKALLKDVKRLEVVAEIGDLFVLRQRWADAKFTYDRMIDLAAPHKERWMAWGYQKLGLIHWKEENWKLASECWKLAQILYRRIGDDDKAAEMGRLLQQVPAEPSAAAD